MIPLSMVKYMPNMYPFCDLLRILRCISCSILLLNVGNRITITHAYTLIVVIECRYILGKDLIGTSN